MGSLSGRAAFLDRDGTLNVRPGEHEYLTHLDQFVWLPDAPKALARLSRAGYVLAVVSNQRGVGRGLVSTSVLRQIEQRIQDDLAGLGCRIEVFRYCFHELTDGCDCPKPRPGMLQDVSRDLDLDLERSWMIGDAESDVTAGKAAGCHTAFVGPGGLAGGADVVAPSLDQASRTIAALGSGPRGA